LNSSTRVCPWQHAWGLDNWVRKLIQNPYKIVGGYIEQGQTVLDLGCGPGVFSIAMAEMVGKKGKVISVDIQDEMLQMLKRRSEQVGLESRIHLHKSQPDKIGVSEKVDFALAFYMIHEVPNIESFLGEVAAILKTQGKLLIVEPKFHISKSSFEDTIKIAQSAGLRPISWPKIFFSRAVLLQRNSI
jgi:ubiquinone/menaquinone biosynthesis C-methylase UbiE